MLFFKGYCEWMTKSYKRIDQKTSFVNDETFKTCFFAWASHQKIEFLQQCPGCGPNPEVLACDGTRIRIAQISKTITPIPDFGEGNS